MKKRVIKIFLLFFILFGSIVTIDILEYKNQNNKQTKLIKTINKKNIQINKFVFLKQENIKKNEKIPVLNKSKGFKGLKWYWHLLIWVGFAIISIPFTIWKRRWKKKRKK